MTKGVHTGRMTVCDRCRCKYCWFMNSETDVWMYNRLSIELRISSWRCPSKLSNWLSPEPGYPAIHMYMYIYIYIYIYNIDYLFIYLYIYIYIEREREIHVYMRQVVIQLVLTDNVWFNHWCTWLLIDTSMVWPVDAYPLFI